MLEAMLFGYERGSFTGAQPAHAGKFEQAQGGTLLLDEITEMPLALQAKLLRVLQEREVERLGGTRRRCALDVRVIATTNRDLRAEVAGGPLPRRSLLPAQRVPPGDLRRCANAATTCCRSRMHLLRCALPPRRAHSGADRRCGAPAAHAMRGPATCASSTTCCSVRWYWSNGSVIEAEHILFEKLSAARLPNGVGARPARRSSGADTGSMERRRAGRDPRGAARRATAAAAKWPRSSASARARCVTSSRACANAGVEVPAA